MDNDSNDELNRIKSNLNDNDDKLRVEEQQPWR